jgi:hypothetical protein
MPFWHTDGEIALRQPVVSGRKWLVRRLTPPPWNRYAPEKNRRGSAAQSVYATDLLGAAGMVLRIRQRLFERRTTETVEQGSAGQIA